MPKRWFDGISIVHVRIDVFAIQSRDYSHMRSAYASPTANQHIGQINCTLPTYTLASAEPSDECHTVSNALLLAHRPGKLYPYAEVVSLVAIS